MNLRCISVALALFVGAWAHAQDYQAMTQAMEKAQADSIKPGDEKLSCEQLEEQLISITQSPEFQAHVGAISADAQKQQAAMNVSKGQIAVQTFRTMLMTS